MNSSEDIIIVPSAVVNTGTKFNFRVGLSFKPYFYFSAIFLIFHFISEHIHQSLLKFDKEAVRVTSSLIFHKHIFVYLCLFFRGYPIAQVVLVGS